MIFLEKVLSGPRGTGKSITEIRLTARLSEYIQTFSMEGPAWSLILPHPDPLRHVAGGHQLPEPSSAGEGTSNQSMRFQACSELPRGRRLESSFFGRSRSCSKGSAPDPA